MEVSDLSPVAQDYLKVIWSAAEWGGPPITTKGLAARFATTAANVSATLRRLEGQGLVNYQPYHPAVLTPLGGRLAVGMVRRHRLLETFLAEALGYSWDEVHGEAERLEHAISEVLLERIDQRLGRPSVDPHGDPIPQPDGSLRPQPATQQLSTAEVGEYRVARVSDDDPQLLACLAKLRVVPGARLRVRPVKPLLLHGEPVDLDAEQMAAVRVFRLNRG